MSLLATHPPATIGAATRNLLRNAKVWLTSAAIIALLAIFDPAQISVTIGFAAANLVHIAPFLLLSVTIAAYTNASGADGLIARAFSGSPATMIMFAALAGALSPFCSCGVIPLIAALLSMGVPLSAVMAFWLASPVIDPSMFILTSGVLGFEFASAKMLAAIALGLFGGFSVHMLHAKGALSAPLREGIGNGGCGGAKMRTPQNVVWQFWRETPRIAKFWREAGKTSLFLAKWLLLAFILESLMLAYIPAELVSKLLGGSGVGPIAIATLVGVPAYLNGYAALPLVSGLMQQGLSAGGAMAFLVAGGVTSLPAAIAVYALVRKHIFALYIVLALIGSFLSGLLFQAWSVL